MPTAEVGCGTGIYADRVRDLGWTPVGVDLSAVLRPGGRFVHIVVHPAFCGGFADRSDPEAIVINRGYLDGDWTTDAGHDVRLLPPFLSRPGSVTVKRARPRSR